MRSASWQIKPPFLCSLLRQTITGLLLLQQGPSVIDVLSLKWLRNVFAVAQPQQHACAHLCAASLASTMAE